VGRSDKSSKGGTMKRNSRSDIEAFCVDGNRDDAGARGQEDVTGKPVPGFFEPDGVAGV